MHISTHPHYLKVYFTRSEWQQFAFAIREQIKYLAQRVIEGKYHTYVFCSRERWGKFCQLIPGVKSRIDRHLPNR